MAVPDGLWVTGGTVFLAVTTAGVGAPGEVLRADSEGLVVACGAEALVLSTVQAEGGRRLSAADFLAGHRLVPGDRLFSLEPDA